MLPKKSQINHPPVCIFVLIVIFSHRWIYDTLCIRVLNFLKGLQELAAHVVAFRNVTEAVSSVQVSRVAMVLPFVPSFGKGLALVGWQLHRGWFETQLKATGFLERVSITSRSCVHYSIAFSKGVLFIICLRLTSFTGFEELQSACVSTGTGAIAIWWRPGSRAAHNTKHIHQAHFVKTWQHCPTSTWHQAQSVRIWEASKTGNVNGVVEPKQM